MTGLIVDNFAGGGGASTGIEAALGRPVDIAINHDPEAIAMHRVNHPNTKHYCESVWEVDPREATRGRPVDLAWFSPDCKHFSKAKGGKPVDKTIRGLAWVAVRWAATVKPRVIILENVEEFQTWGPVIDGQPDPKQKGRTFRSFVNALHRQGYRVEWRELKACDYGAPTSRKRFFLIARCDGLPIIWPEPTHGDPATLAVTSGYLKPWRTAAEIIDWSLSCPSIFDRKKPLVENTMRRIAKGLMRFVLDREAEPFIVHCNHTASYYQHFRGQSLDEPLRTITARHGMALVTPYLIQYHGDTRPEEVRGQEMDEPIMTVDTQNRYALVAAFLAKHYGGGYTGPGADLREPAPTITAVDHNALVASHLIKLKGDNIGQAVDQPLQTITAGGLHFGEVRSFLTTYCDSADGNVGSVVIGGERYYVADIGMRMLQPHELYAAQGFPASYIIDKDADGQAITKKSQVARCGNAVPPPLAEALVRANLVTRQREDRTGNDD